MDEHERAQKEAEHKAAALHHLGWETGTGAAIWARVVEDELARHQAAREQFGADAATREDWDRLHGSALALVVAIGQVLAFESRVRRLTGDAELAQARMRFDAVGPDSEALRDLVVHHDAYVVGEGWRQTGVRGPPINKPYLSTFIGWTDRGTSLQLGEEQVTLEASARAAVELAEVVERVREEHLERVEEEANIALWRRYGMSE
jgi:hypothetical protein